MTGLLSFIFGALILTAIIVGGGVALAIIFGRKKRGADKAIGGLEEMAVLKGADVNNNQRRV
ncbi:hypothetical protein [Acutalibacter sp. 1XD8-36]|uniref:hypothetical protein n=1 Tax=Acutalibacter sp. 1XD8-36 TaxID=2320852 RepID=UPI001372FE96|nr:hypothetical protein [Acutalibacter sp. 1XD8-36]